MFTGSMVAIVTPFRDGKIDKEKLTELVEFQIGNNTCGIVSCGTTGESPTLNYEEHDRVVRITIEAANKRVPVIAGTGSNSTQEAIRLTIAARNAGANATLQVVPYYNKPTQEGLYQHYKAIAAAVDLPIILYNVPSRTGVNLLPTTVERLAPIDTIVGVKEASGNLSQVTEIIQRCGDQITVLSGNDGDTLPIMAVGGKGVISVAANIIPNQMAEFVNAFLAGHLEKAKKLNLNLYPLFQAMFLETNPIPVKTALWLMGKINNEFRSPLYYMNDANINKLATVLKKYNLIS